MSVEDLGATITEVSLMEISGRWCKYRVYRFETCLLMGDRFDPNEGPCGT
jgi:hypothetical protein